MPMHASGVPVVCRQSPLLATVALRPSVCGLRAYLHVIVKLSWEAVVVPSALTVT